jgi:DNA-binding PadR family transcriptional regulator
MFDSGQLRLVLLKLLADEPRHGYDLIRAVEELTGGAYAPSPGTVYPTLTMLEEMGQIEAGEAEGGRKAYSVTDAGQAFLAEREEDIARLFERLEHHGERRNRAERAPIRRSMQGLHSALWASVSGSELSDERVHAIAEILDEATRKIERLD